MSDALEKKLEGFLAWYQDLYGDEWFVTPEGAAPAGETGTAAAAEGQSASEETVSPAKKEMTPLVEFFYRIHECQKCPLGATRTKFVFGTGNQYADVMFIGEAPGRDEDLQGKPFVGRSGKLLTEMLAELGIERKEVFIANILKCRPPNNRDPLPEEVSECIPYLHEQIKRIEPKILIALGRVAAQNLLQTTEALGKLRGRIWQFRDIPLVISYHPAYILRNFSQRDKMMDDLRFALKQVQTP